jgi:hypothetical protein
MHTCSICKKGHDPRLSCNEAALLEAVLDAVRVATETGDLRERVIEAILRATQRGT